MEQAWHQTNRGRRILRVEISAKAARSCAGLANFRLFVNFIAYPSAARTRRWATSKPSSTCWERFSSQSRKTKGSLLGTMSALLQKKIGFLPASRSENLRVEILGTQLMTSN